MAIRRLAASLALLPLLFSCALYPPPPPAPEAMPLVAHAGGGVLLPTGNYLHYSNTLEALDQNFAKGHRLFEIDFSWTTDRRVVLAHDWDHYFKIMFARPSGKLSHKEFMALPFRDGLTQLDLDGLIRWLDAHPSARIVTDAKEDSLGTLARIRERFPRHQQLFIPQFYNVGEYSRVRALGYPNPIFTLYRTRISDDELVAFTANKSLFAVTMPWSRGKTPLPARLAENGVFSYGHTVNSVAVMKQLFGWQLGGIYTDEIAPTDSALRESARF